jgi:hypothetical protein
MRLKYAHRCHHGKNGHHYRRHSRALKMQILSKHSDHRRFSENGRPLDFYYISYDVCRSELMSYMLGHFELNHNGKTKEKWKGEF